MKFLIKEKELFHQFSFVFFDQKRKGYRETEGNEESGYTVVT
jgi:hypothetical protein